MSSPLDPNDTFHPATALDYLPPAPLRSLQLRRLQGMVQRAYDRVPLFRGRLAERGLKPADIQSLEDLAQLPFTTKADLRDTYPFGLFASPLEEIVRFHASSGTTGKPIVVAYTREDVQDWAQVMHRCFLACGLHSGDIIQNAYGYGLFTGGLGAHYGAEPWTEAMRRRIEAESPIKAYDIYGLSEIIGPGVAMECLHQAGPHIFEDMFYPEIIDVETGAVLPDGAEGELVLTTLCKRAMPMIRYRTRDITALNSEPCACGRTLRRIQRIARRSDDMLIIRGVNLFPSQIEAALLAVEGTLPHYQIVVDRVKGLDELEIQVEVTAGVFSDTVGALEKLQQELAQAVERVIGIRAHVRLVQPHALQRSEGKARRVLDKRKL